MRVAVLCYDLASNALGRAHVLAQACRPFADVAIWGPTSTGRIWDPLANSSYPPVHPIRLRGRPRFGLDLRRAAERIAREADVVYACKPLSTSYGLARRIRRTQGLPFVLDIDDWELGFLLSGGVQWKILADGLLHLGGLHSYFPTRRLDRLAQREPNKTVSNGFLQKRFGGVLVPHGRDPRILDPSRFEQGEAKRAHGLADARVVLFYGTPRPHKGLEELVDAVNGIPEDDVVCVIAGAVATDPFANSLKARAPDRVRLLGPAPFERLPEIVALADVYVVPQRAGIGTVGQVPAKIFDAMAMAKPVVATAVGDIPAILSEGCGVVVPPGAPDALREAIQGLLNDRPAARAMGRRARTRLVERYSLETMTQHLRPLIESARGR